MSPLDALILGTVQGITEFLPVSSSGHLILAREWLHLNTGDGLAIDAVLQLVTALAVMWYFRKDFYTLAKHLGRAVQGHPMEPASRVLLVALVLGTIPAVIAGLFLEDAMETVFRDPRLVAGVLIAGSGLMVLAEWVHARYREEKPLTVSRGILVGCFQTLALVPGMSRSGSTIGGGILLGLSREQAARFAFLLSVPIILGAGSKKLLELGSAGVPSSEWHMIAIASITAFVVGLASIHYLLKFLKHHTLTAFALYRVALAMLVFAYF